MGWSVLLSVLYAVQLVTSQEYLLPGDIRPTHYDVKVVYDIDPTTNFSFYGLVDIAITAVKSTSKIVLHAQDLVISNGGIRIIGQTDELRVTASKLNDTYNLFTIELDRELRRNQSYLLTIPFSGNLKPGLNGVYISSYVSKETKIKEYLIATQFEAIYARKGFPCFDEPMYKATYTITIGHHRDFTAVSNMPLVTSSNENELESYWRWEQISKTFSKSKSLFVWDSFEKSVPMSTYLVAFVVSKFSYVDSPPMLSTTKFRIWARSDAINQAAYAAEVGPKVLTYFEKWFNVSFPLPKQDMVAIPDFSAGAMENWGLITYRETALLYDKTQSSFLNKERVAEVIAHELAHQWFGNLVTMKWWSDLWLNEGFATFMASLGVAEVEPTWRADRNYAVDNILSVLTLDSLESSHPVSVPIDDPKRISEVFDEISYRKGSTLIRMMTMFLGEEIFKKALHNYLVKYSYQNAEQDDLWRELTAVSQEYGGLARNVSVKEVMDTWTTQTGYPLLTVSRDYSQNSLTVTQKRYLALNSRSPTTSSWWVPLRVLCASDAQDSNEPIEWLAANEGVTTEHRFEHGADPDEWVLFNADMIAPYRVNYDKGNWELLIAALNSKHTSVPVLARVQLLSDAFALAWTNQLDYNIALQLANYLKRESEYLPLSTGLKALAKIENVIKRTPDYGAFQKFVRKLIGETYFKAGGLATKKIINGDDLNSVKLQTATSAWACRMKVPGCEENAIELFRSWMETDNPDENNPIPLDLRRTVYCVAVSRGSVLQWRFVLARKQRANVAAARDALLHALTCTREVWILTQYLEWAITDETEVRRQDAAAVIVSVTHSTVGYYVAREFIYNRIQDIYNAFNSEGRRLGGIIKALLEQFTTQRELDEFLKWRENNSKYLEDAKLSVNQAIEKATVNIAWLNKNRRSVVERLRELSK
ncbi:aminopeptidase N-like [Galleria mellonella]|uniref:Aminopeptidase n=1 Tax=Galleria mellonella TaxID=7137 RepID=A0ABM3MCE4_GALME|nr:aminopeptidase N-like [Galleria mellonella]XP_052749083.1 aminopeptidase N-like [Galleria mellonella]